MPAGRPPTYKTVEEMQTLIDEYFEKSKGEPLMIDGEPYMYKGEIVLINKYPLTVTGLAIALGFTSRAALLNYQGKSEFVNAITRAKLIIEDYANRRLYDKEGVNGAKFTLANNYEGYKERQEVDLSIKEMPDIIIKRFGD